MASLSLSSARCIVLAGCLALLGVGPLARAAAAEGVSPAVFDLPGGPLKEALARYDALTHLSVFFPSELVEGLRAAPVHGRFAPDEALHRLLDGSGLAARAVAPDAFVLVPADPVTTFPPAGAVPPPPGAASPERAYDGLVQARVLQALCGRDGLAPGRHRVALRLQIDAGGRAAQVRLLDTTGDRTRDAALVDAVRHVDFGQPPGDPSRPFVLLLRPPAAGAPPLCPGRP